MLGKEKKITQLPLSSLFSFSFFFFNKASLIYPFSQPPNAPNKENCKIQFHFTNEKATFQGNHHRQKVIFNCWSSNQKKDHQFLFDQLKIK
jgi:hypothetical protein